MSEAPIAGKPVRIGAARPFPVAASLRSFLAFFRAETRDALAERRAFVLSPFVFIAGLILYRVAPAEPSPILLVAGMGLALAALWPARRRLAALRVTTLLAIFWAGFSALPLHGALFGTKMLAAPMHGTFTARLDRVVFDDGDRQRWIVSEIASQAGPLDIRRARVVVARPVEIAPGDLLTARMRLYPVPAPVYRGGYDAQFAGYYAGIGAYGSILGEEIAVVPAPETDAFRLIEAIRAGVARRILSILEPGPGGIAVALVNGDQSRVKEEDRATMALVGLAHVLSISGLHLTLVAGTMYASLRFGLSLVPRLAERWPVKKIAAAGGIATAVAYMLISGMEVPAVRSTIMLVLVFGAVLAARQALTMRNVALAGLLLAAWDPASVFRASYQLSFAAVLALIAVYELFRLTRERRGGPRNRVLAIVLDAAMASLVAGLATVVFTAFHFQQTAPFGVLGNVLAGPVISFVMMPSALFAMLLMPFGLDAPLFHVMGWSIEVMLWIAQWIGVLSGGFDPSPLLSPSALVIAFLGLAWLAFFRRRIRLLGPALVVPLVALLSTERWPDVLIADTSQALAVRHEGEFALMAGRNGSFATMVWSERFMEPIAAAHADTACDPLGCILVSSQGFSVALVRDPAAFAEDCGLADLVVTRLLAPAACREAAQVVDRGDLERLGPHMLRWEAGRSRFSVTPAIGDPGRPWRVRSNGV